MYGSYLFCITDNQIKKMSCPIGSDEINKLKLFIEFCSQNPKTLNLPQLDFLKSFIVKLGGKVPAGEPNFPFSEDKDEYVF